jgi:hypothetical protein
VYHYGTALLTQTRRETRELPNANVDILCIMLELPVYDNTTLHLCYDDNMVGYVTNTKHGQHHFLTCHRSDLQSLQAVFVILHQKGSK